MSSEEDMRNFPRMYETIENYIRKRDRGQLHLKPEAQTAPMRNAITDERTTLTPLIGYLIGEYKRLTDVRDTCDRNFKNTPEFLASYQKADLNQFKTSMALAQAIEYAREFNYIEEKTTDEADRLKERVADLEGDLLKCREENGRLRQNLEGMRQIFHLESSVDEGEQREDEH